MRRKERRLGASRAGTDQPRVRYWRGTGAAAGDRDDALSHARAARQLAHQIRSYRHIRWPPGDVGPSGDLATPFTGIPIDLAESHLEVVCLVCCQTAAAQPWSGSPVVPARIRSWQDEESLIECGKFLET